MKMTTICLLALLPLAAFAAEPPLQTVAGTAQQSAGLVMTIPGVAGQSITVYGINAMCSDDNPANVPGVAVLEGSTADLQKWRRRDAL